MPITLVLCIDHAYFINVIQGKVRATHLVLIFTSCERESCEKAASKKSHFWPCMKKKKKREKKPNVLNTYYVQGSVPGTLTCTHLPSCNNDERQMVLLPPSNSKTKAQRWLGPDHQGGSGECSLYPGQSWVPQLHFQVPRE